MHAHAHGHMFGHDVDLDLGNAWLIGLATLTAIVVAVGVTMIVRGDGGVGATSSSSANAAPVTISEQLTDAQLRLADLRAQQASPALMAPTTSEVLFATQAFDAQQRETALEIDRMLRRDDLPAAPVAA